MVEPLKSWVDILSPTKRGWCFQQKHRAAATWRVPAGNFPTLQKKRMQNKKNNKVEHMSSDHLNHRYLLYTGDYFYPPVI